MSHKKGEYTVLRSLPVLPSTATEATLSFLRVWYVYLVNLCKGLTGKQETRWPVFVFLFSFPLSSSLPSLHGCHTQTALLLDGLQLVGADGLRDQVQLLAHGLVAKGHADVGDVGAPDVVALLTLFDAVGAKPGSLHLTQRRGERAESYATDCGEGQSAGCVGY